MKVALVPAMAWLLALPVRSDDEPSRQRLALIHKMEETFFRVLTKLEAKGDTEKADRMRKAYTLLKEKGLEAKAQQVIDEERRGNYANAARISQEVSALLEELLILLTQADSSRDRTWYDLARELDALIVEQTNLIRTPNKDSQSKLAGRTRDLGDRAKEPELNDAARDMDKAADGDREAAHNALERLRRIRQKLIDDHKDDIDRVRQEVFRRLTDELERIRADQSAVRSRTAALPNDQLTRTQHIEVIALQGIEERLIRLMSEIAKELRQEQATVYVFAADRVIDDMRDVTDMLQAADLSPRNINTQDEILRALQDMIDAFKQEAEGKRKPVCRDPKSPEGPHRLVPNVVELVLLRKIQEALMHRTIAFRTTPRTEWTQIDVLLSRRLSEEQRALGVMMKDLIDRLESSDE